MSLYTLDDIYTFVAPCLYLDQGHQLRLDVVKISYDWVFSTSLFSSTTNHVVPLPRQSWLSLKVRLSPAMPLRQNLWVFLLQIYKVQLLFEKTRVPAINWDSAPDLAGGPNRDPQTPLRFPGISWQKVATSGSGQPKCDHCVTFPEWRI
jgi:hypothetical protein